MIAFRLLVFALTFIIFAPLLMVLLIRADENPAFYAPFVAVALAWFASASWVSLYVAHDEEGGVDVTQSPTRTRKVTIDVLFASALLAVIALALSSCVASEDTSTEPGTSNVPSEAQSETSVSASPPRVDVIPGRSVSETGFISLPTYESDAASYHSGDVVFFFNASWCSTCARPLANLSENPEDIPEGLTVVSVDFDAETDLKKQYGVTTQHTFVQIDEDGTEVTRWSGSRDIADIVSKVE